MPRYVIERELPGAGALTAQQLQAISRASCDVLKGMGPEIQWVESYVTTDRLYCVYVSPNEDSLVRHAAEGGFPVTRIARVSTVIGPTTAE